MIVVMHGGLRPVRIQQRLAVYTFADIGYMRSMVTFLVAFIKVAWVPTLVRGMTQEHGSVLRSCFRQQDMPWAARSSV